MQNIIPSKFPNTVYRIVEGEAVIVEPEKGLVTVINTVGSRIWELINGKRTVAEIIAIIREEYKVSKDTYLQDVIEFINEINDKNLISFH